MPVSEAGGGQWEDFRARRERPQVEGTGSWRVFLGCSLCLSGDLSGGPAQDCVDEGCRGGCPEPSTFSSHGFGKRAALALTIPGRRVGGTGEHSCGGW